MAALVGLAFQTRTGGPRSIQHIDGTRSKLGVLHSNINSLARMGMGRSTTHTEVKVSWV